MAVVQRDAGGRIKLLGKRHALHYRRRKADDKRKRMRFSAVDLARRLEEVGIFRPDAAGRCGWGNAGVTARETDGIERLTYCQLRTLRCGLRARADQTDVAVA